MDRVLAGSCLPGMEMAADRDESSGLDLSLSLQRSPSSPPTFQAVFACCYCPRKFRSSQALGGHQNAHKLQRNLTRRGRDAASAPPAPVAAAVADQQGGNNNRVPDSESAPTPRSTAELGIVVDAWGEGRHHHRRYLHLGTAAGGTASASSAGARGAGELNKEEMIDLSLKL